MSLTGRVGVPLMFEATTADRDASAVPQARLIDSTQAQVGAVISLTSIPVRAHVWQGSITAPTFGHFSINVDWYTDGTFTTLTDHEPGLCHIRIGDELDHADAVWEENLRTHLGDTAAQEVIISAAQGGDRVRHDVIAWDTINDAPLTIRTRIFDTSANAVGSNHGATGETGEIITILETATHTTPTRWKELVRRVVP